MGDPEAERARSLWRDTIQWRVKDVARSRGILSSSQLSERCGLNKNSANAIWNGTALRIDRDSLGKLCHTLGCVPGDLLEFIGKQSESEK
jgi:DNA-binding Xre family transcriptional regulator